MKPSEEVREIRNVLFDRGWHQGDFEGPNGEVCIYGAQRVARYGSVRWAPESPESFLDDQPLLAIRKACGDWPPDFNDMPGRTFTEVIDMLDRAEKLALIEEETTTNGGK